MGTIDKSKEIKTRAAKQSPNTKPMALSSEMIPTQSSSNANNDNASSPIYKELNESGKKLTLLTFGPTRRPTDGRIHCAIRVETNDFKGQCCIAFKYTDLATRLKMNKKLIYF